MNSERYLALYLSASVVFLSCCSFAQHVHDLLETVDRMSTLAHARANGRHFMPAHEPSTEFSSFIKAFDMGWPHAVTAVRIRGGHFQNNASDCIDNLGEWWSGIMGTISGTRNDFWALRSKSFLFHCFHITS